MGGNNAISIPAIINIIPLIIIMPHQNCTTIINQIKVVLDIRQQFYTNI